MLTLGAYVRYVRRPPSLIRYGVVVLLFALGLLSKNMLVTMPFVLLLLDYWPLNRLFKLHASGFAPAGGRENPPVGADSRVVCGDGPGSGKSARWQQSIFRAADGKRRGILRHLLWQMIHPSGWRVFIRSRKLPAALAGGRAVGCCWPSPERRGHFAGRIPA